MFSDINTDMLKEIRYDIFSGESSIETEITECIAMNNEDKLSGLNCCIICKQPVYLFGCIVVVSNTEKSYGESKLYLACNNVYNN